MLNWYNFYDRVIFGLPVLLGAFAIMLLIAYAEERARQTRARKRRAKRYKRGL